MTWGSFSLFFVGSAAAAWLGGFLVYWALAKCHIVDVPNARSSHNKVVIRGGGLTILLILAVYWMLGALDIAHFELLNPWIIGGVILLAVVSFTDDVVSLPYWARLPVHGIAATLAIVGIWNSTGGDTFHGVQGALITGCAWVWVIGYLNAFNFMDGINGIATSQTLVTALFGFLFCNLTETSEPSTWLGFQIVLAGAALGFLPHNFPKARMFLGDVGSITLGFLLAFLVIAVWNVAGWKAGVALGAMHLNFLMDSSITMLRRFLRGEKIHQPHREHFYQRLHRSGASHSTVTSLEMILQLGFGVLLLITFQTSAFGIVLLAIISGWLLFFRFCEKRFLEFSEAEAMQKANEPVK